MKKKSTLSRIRAFPLSIHCLCSFVFFSWCTALAQAPVTLVKDVNTAGDSYYSEFGIVADGGDKLFFFADGGLYVSEGTHETTQKIYDFISIAAVIHYNGALVFAGNDGSGMALWRSNGTPAGTVKLKAIAPYNYFMYDDGDFTIVQGTLFFTADDGVTGRELWKTDGTSAGTVRVKDIKPGSTSSNPIELTAVNDRLFFVAPSGNNKGMELWVSDGTAAGTVVVRDIFPGSNSSDPAHLTAVNNEVFFSAKDGISGIELWKSDGTATGTMLVKDIRPGSANASINKLTAVNDVLFFEAHDGVHGKELWKSDGSEAGTMLVKDITPGPGAAAGFAIDHLDDFKAHNGQLFFTAFQKGHRLWKSDGTAAGTIPLTPANQVEFGFLETDMEIYNNELYFLAQSSYDVAQLWKTDGTVSGTVAVNPALADFDYGTYAQIEPCGSILYLLGAAFNSSEHPGNTALLRSDGTLAGTEEIFDITEYTLGSMPISLATAGSNVYFSALRGQSYSRDLWRSDGTENGTVKVSEFESVNYIRPYGNKVLFQATRNSNAAGLWISDGTEAGTNLLTAPGSQGFAVTYPSAMAIIGDEVIFGGNSNAGSGAELWKTDGTPEGTVMIKDIYPGPTNSSASHMVRLGNQVIFAASTPAEGHELWSTDGTAAGTVLIKDIRLNEGSSIPRNLTVAESKVFFTADDGTGGGMEVWATDGTTSGTSRLSNLSKVDPLINSLVSFNGKVLFGATDADGNRALWASDGSPEGTMLIKDFLPGAEIIYYAGQNEQYAFWLITPTSGWSNTTTLWRTDGTAEGTVEIFNVNFSMPHTKGTATFGDVVYFVTDTTPAIWRTDGTSCGTAVATNTDIWLEELAVFNGKMFFSGTQYNDDGYTPVGAELYSFTPAAVSPCEDNARIAVEQPSIIEDTDLVSAYPNPSRGTFTINITGSEQHRYQLEVVTVNGKSVESFPELSYNKAYQFGSQWGAGVYIMRAVVEGRLVTRKLVKTN